MAKQNFLSHGYLLRTGQSGRAAGGGKCRSGAGPGSAEAQQGREAPKRKEGGSGEICSWTRTLAGGRAAGGGADGIKAPHQGPAARSEQSNDQYSKCAEPPRNDEPVNSCKPAAPRQIDGERTTAPARMRGNAGAGGPQEILGGRARRRGAQPRA
ncbi:hypothetical protein B0H17DRAFT_1146868 [Mycena rosella]|uniref:Uncharacterized protein n=1 Tax=Mycena rosella TaxID=1033263 RepID=A0AAD7CN13_MYCRO|nr:hypothetical protein B0H17DRAFT_1146868 [Mycena rosella]